MGARTSEHHDSARRCNNPYDISPSPSITPELELDDAEELEKERAATNAAEEKAAQEEQFKQHKIDMQQAATERWQSAKAKEAINQRLIRGTTAELNLPVSETAADTQPAVELMVTGPKPEQDPDNKEVSAANAAQTPPKSKASNPWSKRADQEGLLPDHFSESKDRKLNESEIEYDLDGGEIWGK